MLLIMLLISGVSTLYALDQWSKYSMLLIDQWSMYSMLLIMLLISGVSTLYALDQWRSIINALDQWSKNSMLLISGVGTIYALDYRKWVIQAKKIKVGSISNNYASECWNRCSNCPQFAIWPWTYQVIM